MTKKLKQLTKEIIAGGASVDGNPTFRGGPYGYGHKQQIATNLNPATKNIEKQEQDELNQNVDSIDWSLDGKYHDSKISDFLQTERTASDAFAPAPHLPGNRRENSLEAAEIHVPLEDPRETDDYVIDQLEEKVLEELLQELSNEEGFTYSFPTTMPDLDPKNNPEKHGHFTLDPAKKSPGAGMGQVLAPKDFIPDENPQTSKFKDDDLDGIPNHLDPNTEPELKREIDKMDEKLDPKTHSAKDYVKDFQKSDAPQFKGKSKEKRKQMALAAYYNDKTNEELDIDSLTEEILRIILEKFNEQ